MKVIIAKPHVRGQRRILPTLGETAIPKDGRLELEDDELAVGLVGTGEWDLEESEEEEKEETPAAPAKKGQKKEPVKPAAPAEPAQETVAQVLAKASKEELEAALEQMDITQLQALSKEAKLKGGHLIKDPVKLRAFIVNKFTAEG